MSVIVRDTGFVPDDLPPGLAAGALPPAGLPAEGPVAAVALQPDDDPALLAGRLGGIGVILVRFPAFSDGRGFTLAMRLRRMGFAGRLRAVGPVIADQYAMARRSGFDEVEIPDDLAARQPEAQWLRRAAWRSHDYRARLGARRPASVP